MTNPLFDLTGRTALITGSSQGIGLALAHGLHDAGATVVLNGRREAKLHEASQQFDGRVRTATFDVTDSDSVEHGIAAIEKGVGPIDILVNNAGIQIRNRLDQFTDDDWGRLMKTNLDSVFYVSRAVVKRMIERKAGKIINIASVNAALARPTIAPYTASKGGIVMLTKGMCVDWGPLGIQVNALAPGYFETELTDALVKDETFTGWLEGRTPARRWGKVEELNGACVFLASDASSFVNGHVMYVDGGVSAAL